MKHPPGFHSCLQGLPRMQHRPGYERQGQTHITSPAELVGPTSPVSRQRFEHWETVWEESKNAPTQTLTKREWVNGLIRHCRNVQQHCEIHWSTCHGAWRCILVLKWATHLVPSWETQGSKHCSFVPWLSCSLPLVSAPQFFFKTFLSPCWREFGKTGMVPCSYLAKGWAIAFCFPAIWITGRVKKQN